MLTNVFPGTLAIQNTGNAPVQLAVRPVIEREDASGAWIKLDGIDGEGHGDRGLRLVESCGDKPGACVTIQPHDTFHPQPLSGWFCNAQCNDACLSNSFLSGRHRWVVSACGGASLAGPAFELPTEAEALGRFGVTEDLVSGVAMRLDEPAGDWEAAAPPKVGTILGLTVRAGSAHPIGAADLTALVALLRSPTGFDEHIADECRMRTWVGLRLLRRPASTGVPEEQAAELFFDFACNVLFVGHDGLGAGHRRTIWRSNFQPNRAAVVALVKRLLPSDPELAKLP